MMEKGLTFVDSKGKSLASFPVDENGGNRFTSDMEVLRKNSVRMSYRAPLDKTEYQFAAHMTAIYQKDGKRLRVSMKKEGE